VRLLHIETTRFGEQDDQKQIAFAIDFDNINTFLSSPLGLEELGLKLSKDSEGNLHLKGTPSALVATPPTGGGVPSLGLIISQMKSEIGIAGDPNFDKLLRRLLNSPKSTLTFATPAPVKQTNGTLVQDNKVEWNVDIITAASTPSGNLLLSPSFLMIRVKTSLWERVHVGVNLLCEDRRRYEGLITNTPNCLSARQVCQRMAPHCCRLQGPPCVQEIL
jgi:hypothetical protein